GPPACGLWVDGLYFPVPVDPGETLQLLTNDCGEQLALGRRRGVLEVATTALGSEATRGLHSPGRGVDDVDGVGAQEALRPVGDADPDSFPRQGMPDEHDLPVEAR